MNIKIVMIAEYPENQLFRTFVTDETNPYMWFCSGILVTLTHVLTADHTPGF